MEDSDASYTQQNISRGKGLSEVHTGRPDEPQNPLEVLQEPQCEIQQDRHSSSILSRTRIEQMGIYSYWHWQ